MNGLKSATLFFIGLAFCLELMSTSYAHADGVKTPLPGFTPAKISTPRSNGVPTRIHFAENTPAPKDSPTAYAPSNTSLAPRVTSAASTTTKSNEPTVASAASTVKTTGTAVISLHGTSTLTALSLRSTLFVTSAAEREGSKTPRPGRPTMSIDFDSSTSEPAETPLFPLTEVPQKPTLGDVLQELPDNTAIMVVGEGEKPLPLVSQEAAQALAQDDPVWCPDTQLLPTPGANGCTISYPTLALLVANAGAGINANGTIWITSGSQSEPGTVTIDGSIYTNWSNSSLTLQGGWTGTAIGPNSVFNVPIQILNWNRNVSINNITVQNAAGSGLGVTTNGGNVAINNSRFLNNRADSSGTYFPWGDGADISPNGGNVTIMNSEFSGNFFDGLYIENSGQISITNSSLNSNGHAQRYGGGLSAYLVNGIDIHNTEFTNNLSYDINAYCNSGRGLVVSYPDSFFPYPPPVRMDISVDFNCNATAYLVLSTATPSPTLTPTATPTGPTQTATATPTGPTITASVTITATASPTSTPTVAPSPIVIYPDTATPSPTGAPLATPTSHRRLPTIQPRNSFSGSGSSRPKSKGEFFLDCKLQESFTYSLPNGDKVEIICPSGYWSGKASISRLDNTTLPDELPAGYTYASAFVVNISKLSEPVRLVGGEFVREDVNMIPAGGYIKASFVAPDQGDYSILYWDASRNRWIPLKDFLLNEDGSPQVFDLYPEGTDGSLKIISGVQQVTNPFDPRVEVSTNFPGIFVLAQH